MLPDFTPVTLITGFLGSGKTTLLQRLLLDPRLSDTAVLINEFGEIGLGGFKRSSQHGLFRLIVGTHHAPLQVFSIRASCEACR